MEPIRYANGSPVIVGDEVSLRIKKLLGRERQHSGLVRFVCDVAQPIQREINDYGVSIDVIGTQQSLWYGGPELPPDVAKIEPRFDFDLLDPWEEVVGDGRGLVDELKRELRTDHVLHGLAAEACARRIDCDDVLFRISGRDEQFAVVHLTWSGKIDPNEGWPFTTLYADIENWKSECMMPDHEDYTT